MPADESVTFLAKTVAVAGREYRYAVYVPPSAEQFLPNYPVLVFLHDKNESGDDGRKQLEVGLGPAIRRGPGRWPFLTVFPQKPDADSDWLDHEAVVMATLAAVEAEYHTDSWRRHLTGVGQGGVGACAIGGLHPKVWAGIAPVGVAGDAVQIAAPRGPSSVWAFDDVHEAYSDSALAEWFRDKSHASGIGDVLRTPLDVASAFALTIDTITESRHGTGRLVEQVRLTSYATTMTFGEQRPWRVELRRWHESGTGASFKRVNVAAPRDVGVTRVSAEACLAECVRLLLRAGLYDGPRDDVENCDYVELEWSQGFGGRSVSMFPRRWKVGGVHGEQIAAARAAGRLIRKLHAEAAGVRPFPLLPVGVVVGVLLLATLVFRRCQLPRPQP